MYPFPGKPHLSTRPINPHAQRLVLAGKQPVEYQAPAKPKPKSKAKAKAKAKAKSANKKPKAKAKARPDGTVTPYTAAFESFKEQPPSRYSTYTVSLQFVSWICSLGVISEIRLFEAEPDLKFKDVRERCHVDYNTRARVLSFLRSSSAVISS